MTDGGVPADEPREEPARDEAAEDGGESKAATDGSQVVPQGARATEGGPGEGGQPASEQPGAEPTEDDGEGDEPSVAAVFGANPEDAPPRPPIVPEQPDLEHVLFVVLGVTFGLFVIWRAVVVFAP